MELNTESREYSNKYVAGSSDYDLFANKNVDWMSDGPFTKIFYISAIFIMWGLVHVSQLFSPQDCWTVVNIVHFIITFVMFHWIKGCPDPSTQGEYNAFTLYEQLDAGIPYTSTKKFLMLMPTLITWMACYIADYKPLYIIVNCGLGLILVIGKIPEMHRVRIFGINSTPGIDTTIEYSPRQSERKKKAI